MYVREQKKGASAKERGERRKIQRKEKVRKSMFAKEENIGKRFGKGGGRG